MARLARCTKEVDAKDSQVEEALSALTDFSPNTVPSRRPDPSKSAKASLSKTKLIESLRRPLDSASIVQRQRAFKVQHVDSLTLPSLNGVSSKSYEEGLLPRADMASPARETARRSVKQTVSYAEALDSPVIDGAVSEVSEWSELACSEDEVGSVEEELRPRSLWPLRAEPTSNEDVVDLTRPRKAQTRPKGVGRGSEQSSRISSCSDDDSNAILSFSPPRSRSPLKRPPVAERAATPPASPSKSRLTSPSKSQKFKVPPTAHRPSVDAFWSQEVVNAWNDEYSPKKLLPSPRKLLQIPLSATHNDSDNDTVCSPTKASPTKSPSKRQPQTPRSREAAAAKKAFEQRKHKLASDFLAELDMKIANGKIDRMAASTGGVKIVWSKTLNSTAGRANWKCESLKTRREDGQVDVMYKHTASIELAEKVIDDEDRLLNVLAHEFCHLLNFMISAIRNNPHGASFKRWASLVSSTFAARNIHVTTKHSYDINYKYAWRCTDEEGCGTEYERHSRSIDPKRHTCGKCKGRLVQVRPVPRGVKGGEGSGDKTDSAEAKGPQSEYQKFVKENFGVVRTELGQASPMKDVMREVGVRYRLLKEEQGKSGVGATREPKVKRVEKVVEVIEILDTDDEVEQGDEEGDVDVLDLPDVLRALTIRDG